MVLVLLVIVANAVTDTSLFGVFLLSAEGAQFTKRVKSVNVSSSWSFLTLSSL